MNTPADILARLLQEIKHLEGLAAYAEADSSNPANLEYADAVAKAERNHSLALVKAQDKREKAYNSNKFHKDLVKARAKLAQFREQFPNVTA